MDPGWYPDPNSPGNERYWDGVGWVRSNNPRSASPPRTKVVTGRSWRDRLRAVPIPLPILAVVAVALLAIGAIGLLTGGDDDGPGDSALPAGSPGADPYEAALDTVQQVFASNGVTCTASGSFPQRPLFVADRLPALGTLMGWSDDEKAAARRLANDFGQLATLGSMPLRQINCGDDEEFPQLGGLIVASPSPEGDRLPVLVYVAAANQLRPQLSDAGALVVLVELDREGPQTSGCRGEKQLIELALAQRVTATGAYPDALSELLTDPAASGLSADPSPRWIYDPAQPSTVVGKQACDGY